MSLITVDQRFIKNLEHIAFDLSKPEASHVVHDATDESFASRIGDHPVEKVAFNRTVNSRRSKRLAGKHAPGVVLAKVHHSNRDALGDDHEITVLEPQRLGLDLAAVNELEELGP